MSKMYPPPSTPSPNTDKATVITQHTPQSLILGVKGSDELGGNGESVLSLIVGTNMILLTHETALELIGALYDVMEQQDAEDELLIAPMDVDYRGNVRPIED